MKYKCLVFDHDDTVVNSTATIHHPCFQLFLDERFPGRVCSLEHYFQKNFSPGFLEMCREEYGMDDRMIEDETQFWLQYVESHVPAAYDGILAIMERQKDAGGLLAVVSHSHVRNIRRDYAANGLPEPDIVYGWEQPPEERKPAPFPLEDIMRRFSRRGLCGRRVGERYPDDRGVHAPQLQILLQDRGGTGFLPAVNILFFQVEHRI